MSIKFNNADAIYGGFSNVTPTPKRNNNRADNDAALGAAMIIGGLLGAAAVAAAADEDYTSCRAAEIRREAEREAARREAEREAKRRAEEIRREAERAVRKAAYGLTIDEITHEIVKFCMKESISDKMVVMTAVARELIDRQYATINFAKSEYGDLRMKGRCVDGTDLRIELNSIGGITIYAYGAKLVRYSSSNKVYEEYKSLVTDEEKFAKLARVMAY